MDLLKLILTYMVVLTGTAVQAVDATPLPYEALHTPSPTPRIYVLNNGSRGTSVRNLQARLKELGYLHEEPDGYYGPKTAEAVKYFQQVNGLEADGVAGRLTQEKMFFDPYVLPAPTAAPLQ